MGFYLGSYEAFIYLNNQKLKIVPLSPPLTPTKITLKSSDAYILQDVNGSVLVAKEGKNE